MTCDSCVKSVSDALYSLDGITNVDVSLKDQLVTVEGTGKISLQRKTSTSTTYVILYK